MKTIVKQMIMTGLLSLVMMPAFAGEMTKGTKSYQSRTPQDNQRTANTPDAPSADDVADIAPAAGDTTVDAPEKDTQKSLREDMRLPRKH